LTHALCPGVAAITCCREDGGPAVCLSHGRTRLVRDATHPRHTTIKKCGDRNHLVGPCQSSPSKHYPYFGQSPATARTVSFSYDGKAVISPYAFLRCRSVHQVLLGSRTCKSLLTSVRHHASLLKHGKRPPPAFPAAVFLSVIPYRILQPPNLGNHRSTVFSVCNGILANKPSASLFSTAADFLAMVLERLSSHGGQPGSSELFLWTGSRLSRWPASTTALACASLRVPVATLSEACSSAISRAAQDILLGLSTLPAEAASRRVRRGHRCRTGTDPGGVSRQRPRPGGETFLGRPRLFFRLGRFVDNLRCVPALA
jgi:hypothetical protein